MGWGTGGSASSCSSCSRLWALSPFRASPVTLFSLAAEELRKLHTEALYPQEGPKAHYLGSDGPRQFLTIVSLRQRLRDRDGRWPSFNSLIPNSGCHCRSISWNSLWNSTFIPGSPPADSALQLIKPWQYCGRSPSRHLSLWRTQDLTWLF